MFDITLRTLMPHLVLSRNGDESFNNFFSPDPDPDPDHVRGRTEPREYVLCKKIKSIGAIVFVRKETNRPNALVPLHGSKGNQRLT